jgi:predicted aspartyl protease
MNVTPKTGDYIAEEYHRVDRRSTQRRYHDRRSTVSTFKHPVEVAAAESGLFVSLEGLVDTGATYSLFPRTLMARLGVVSHDRAGFVLADGRSVTRELATVVLRLWRTRCVARGRQALHRD